MSFSERIRKISKKTHRKTHKNNTTKRSIKKTPFSKRKLKQ